MLRGRVDLWHPNAEEGHVFGIRVTAKDLFVICEDEIEFSIEIFAVGRTSFGRLLEVVDTPRVLRAGEPSEISIGRENDIHARGIIAVVDPLEVLGRNLAVRDRRTVGAEEGIKYPDLQWDHDLLAAFRNISFASACGHRCCSVLYDL